MFFDRRKKDHRKEPAKALPPERRARAERRIGERRKWPYGVLFRTRLPMTAIEDWLDERAEGRWAVSLEGIDDKLQQKTLKLSFEKDSDKRMLMAHFAPKSDDQ